MLQVNYIQKPVATGEIPASTGFTVLLEPQSETPLDILAAKLSAEIPWGERQCAAKKLGFLADPAALPALLKALPTDSFWMVRCAIIQALQRIGDPEAIPVLRQAAKEDAYQVVRSYAKKAIERLS